MNVARNLVSLVALTFVVSTVVLLARVRRPPLVSEQNAATEITWLNAQGKPVRSISLRGHFTQPRFINGSLYLTHVSPGNEEIGIVQHDTFNKLNDGLFPVAPAVYSKWPDVSPKVSFHGKMLLSDEPGAFFPEDVSNNGQQLLVRRALGDKQSVCILRPAHKFLVCNGDHDYDARMSLDGNSIAFTALRNGREWVFVTHQPLTLADARCVGEGHSPAWTSQGLLFVAPGNILRNEETALFTLPAGDEGVAISSDASTFVTLLFGPIA